MHVACVLDKDFLHCLLHKLKGKEQGKNPNNERTA
jgi:hypothetical protein